MQSYHYYYTLQRCLSTIITLEILCLVLEEAPSSQCLEASEYRDTYTVGILFVFSMEMVFCSCELSQLCTGCVYQFINISLYSNADGRFNLGTSHNDAVLLLPLPDGVDACDISTLTIWCRPFSAIFNRVTLTRSVFVSCSLHEQSLCSNYSLII